MKNEIELISIKSIIIQKILFQILFFADDPNNIQFEVSVEDKNISVNVRQKKYQIDLIDVLSDSYLRIRDFAKSNGFEIEIVTDFGIWEGENK
jgi:hypothetical protein